MNTANALALLGVSRPEIKGKTQAEVDEKLQAWKEESLRPAYKAKLHETHPDKHPNDPMASTKFQMVKAAYEKLKVLKINAPRKPRPPVTHCPHGHDRIPTTAKYCHECGYCFSMDALEQRLRRRGILPASVAQIRAEGTYDKLLGMNPMDAQLDQEIEVLWQRQRLGLFGRHSGWRG